MKLTVFKYAESDLAHSQAFYGGDSAKKIPISFLFYMIEVDKRRILVDVGCNELSGFDMRLFVKPLDLLKRCRIDACDITDVIITHADWDHVGTISEFAHANIYIQEQEYERERAHFAECSHIHLFNEECVLCSNIRIAKIGGHQVGSSVVEIMDVTGIYVLGGDECYVNDCLKHKIPTGSTHCLERSKYFVEHYSDEKYKVWLYHDASVMPGQNGAMKIF